MTTPRNISIEETVTPRSQRDPNTVQASFEALDQSLLKSLPTEVNSKGVVPIDIATLPADGTSSLELLSELLTIEKVSELQAVWAYTPNVIEPSFVLGCILYCLPEQTYWHRPQDAARAVSHTVPLLSCLVKVQSLRQLLGSSLPLVTQSSPALNDPVNDIESSAQITENLAPSSTQGEDTDTTVCCCDKSLQHAEASSRGGRYGIVSMIPGRFVIEQLLSSWFTGRHRREMKAPLDSNTYVTVWTAVTPQAGRPKKRQ